MVLLPVKPGVVPATRAFVGRRLSPGRPATALRAGEGDDGSRSFEGDFFRLLEATLVSGRESVEKVELDALPHQLEALKGALEGGRQAGLEKYDGLLELTRGATKRLLAGEEVYLDQFADEFFYELTPRIPLVLALLRAGQSVFSVLVLGWLWSLLRVDPWRYWHMPSTNFSSWIAWTLPYVICTGVFWQDWFLEDVVPVKGYKLARRCTMEQDITIPFLKNASTISLVVDSFFRSLAEVFKDQGCYYGAMSVLFLGPVGNVNGIPDTFVGGTPQLILPKPIRSVQAVGALGLLLSLGSVLEDPTLSTFLLNDLSRLSVSAPLSGTSSNEEFHMLMDSKAVEARRGLTAVLGGLQAVYLTSEMLSTNSLYTSICTSSVGMFIFLQAVRRNMVTQEPA